VAGAAPGPAATDPEPLPTPPARAPLPPPDGRPRRERQVRRERLEALRDEWLLPFVARVESLAEAVGRLQTERDGLARERDRLTATHRDLDRQRRLDWRAADRMVALLEQQRDAALGRVHALEGERDVAQTRLAACLAVIAANSPAPPVGTTTASATVTMDDHLSYPRLWWRRRRGDEERPTGDASRLA